MGDMYILTAQAWKSNCKTWYENEFQVSYETWPVAAVVQPFTLNFSG